MELTTENIIKIVLGVFVIVALVLGIYFAMKFYVIPYFSGIGFEEPKIDPNSEFGKELLKPENLVGTINNDRYFVLKDGTKTKIQFPKGENKIYLIRHFGELETGFWGIFNPFKRMKPNLEIGSWADGGKITITRKEVEYADKLENAYRNGEKEIKAIQ